MSDFERELTALINQHSRENDSNTPDYILAMYMEACLAAFSTAVQQRETWYGRDASPASHGADWKDHPDYAKAISNGMPPSGRKA